MHRDSIAVRREGAAQICLVGPPNVGKSSILQALSEIQIKTGDYPFTTLRPIPALTRIGGVLVQLVEIPGLIEGATDDRGGGRALLGVLRSADAIVYCTRADGDPRRSGRSAPRSQLAGIDKPAFLAATRADEAGRGASRASRRRFPTSRSCRCRSSTRPASRPSATAVWRLTGLIRVRLRTIRATTDPEPVALEPGSTVEDVADWVHHDLAATFSGARVWGPSARFEGQRVGRDHAVLDGDVVEILR